MKTIVALYALAGLLTLLGLGPDADATLTHAILPVLGAIATGVGAVGGLYQGAKRQRSADRLNREAINTAREDRAERQPYRSRAGQMLMGDQPQAPGFRRVAPGQATDFSGARGEFSGARLPGMGEAARTAQGYQMGALGEVGGGADRGEIAAQRYGQLLDQSQDARKLGTERIGQDAARLGRIGMGGVSTSLGNLEERIQKGITDEGGRLASWAAEGDISDRRADLGAISGVAGQLRGDDFREGATGADLALRRGDREARLGEVEFGQGAQLRGEERGERGTERDYFDRDQANRFGTIDRLSGIGFGGPSPVGPLMAGAQAQSQQGANSAAGAGNLLQSYMQWKQMQGGGQTTPPIRPVGQTSSQPAYG